MMEFPNPSIPLRLSIDFGGEFGDEDVHEHEVRFHVAGAPESQVIATVQTDPVILPRVLRYRRRGGLDLPPADTSASDARATMTRVTTPCSRS